MLISVFELQRSDMEGEIDYQAVSSSSSLLYTSARVFARSLVGSIFLHSTSLSFPRHHPLFIYILFSRYRFATALIGHALRPLRTGWSRIKGFQDELLAIGLMTVLPGQSISRRAPITSLMSD
jgi:hypothetical protein